jgi:hypothetical protein
MNNQEELFNPSFTEKDVSRFLKHVDKTPGYGPNGDCWIWTACINGAYGNFYIGGKISKAHRASYIFFKGPFKASLNILHSCNVGICQNPKHLSADTQKKNVQDIVVSGNNFQSNKTHCKRGHEYTPENTIMQPGGRLCKECRNINALKYYYGEKALGTPLEELYKLVTIDPETNCHLITGAKLHPGGYYRKMINDKTIGAHKYVWLQANNLEELPPHPETGKRQLIRHAAICGGRRNCIQIEHLSIGTDADNIQDQLEANRNFHANLTHCRTCGLELSGDNLYINPANNERVCMNCQRQYKRDFYAKNKEKILAKKKAKIL